MIESYDSPIAFDHEHVFLGATTISRLASVALRRKDRAGGSSASFMDVKQHFSLWDIVGLDLDRG